MPITRLLAALAFLLTTPSVLHAQGSRPLEEVRQRLLADTPPAAAFWRGDGTDSGIVVFHRITNVAEPLGDFRYPAIWFARREFNNASGAPSTTYADSRNCPAIIGVLAWMERLDPPSVRFPGLLGVLPQGAGGPPLPHPPDPHDGRNHYTVWGRGFDANSQAVDVTFSGSTDLIAGFGDAALERLEPCWEAEPPEPPRHAH